jgi:hypothetical protein
MRPVPGLCAAFGVVVAAVSLIAVSLPAPVSDVQAHPVRLASGDTADSPLGDGVALIMGTSGNPMPPLIYADAIDQLYLAPRGFDGTTQVLYTPESLYPFTGVKSLPFDVSEDQDAQALYAAILNQIDGGHVDAANPVVVFGWSQSADITGPVMQELAAAGVPSDDVHFVLVGDANNLNGGILNRFDIDGLHPTVPSLGIPFGGTTPDNLYPTDIYSTEYAAPADFPQYPIDFLADLNAALGIIFGHIQYPALTHEQIADAVALPTTGDTMTNYYMIPQDLPLLDIFRFIPVIGNPLADLLQPDLAVLVNVGYGSITEGWSQGPANVFTPFSLLPPVDVLAQVPQALVNGVPQGITAAIGDLQDPANYQIIPFILDNPMTNQLIDVAHLLGFTDATNLTQLLDYPSLHDAIPNLLGVAQEALAGFANFPISHASLLSSPTDLINDLSGTASYDYSSLLPVADAVNALLTSLPAYDASVFAAELQAGDPLAAIGDPIAADLVLIPAGIVFGVANAVEAVGGTLVNLVDLIPGI